jgi:hypothetical protein
MLLSEKIELERNRQVLETVRSVEALNRVLSDLEEVGLEVVSVKSDAGSLPKGDFNLGHSMFFHRHVVRLRGGVCLAVVSRIGTPGWTVFGGPPADVLYFSVCGDVHDFLIWSKHAVNGLWYNWPFDLQENVWCNSVDLILSRHIVCQEDWPKLLKCLRRMLT